MSSSLAIVERKPPLNGGGCAGGVLFHLLDWHRRLARKRRLFSPRRLLPSSLRSAPRRLQAPPPSPTPPPPPAPHTAAAGADGAAPGVVARLMGLESWPGGAAGTPRPQKQRKVEASSPHDGGDSAVVLVLPTTRRPPASAPAPAAATAPRSHHGSDLPARSPRRTRLVHAAAAKLLEPGTRSSSRASAWLALAYACSSPQHRKDGHSGALLQGSGMADDFLARSGSLSTLERSTRLQEPPVPPAEETECDRPAVSRRHRSHSFNSGDAVIGGASTVVLPRMDFGVANMGKSSSDVDAMRKERRIRNEGISTCAKVRSSIPSVRAGDERLRKRATPTRPEVYESADPAGLASSTRQFGRAQEPKTSAGRRVAHSSPGPRRDITGSVTRNTQCRDVINRSGLASTTSRISSNGSGPRRVSRKNVGCAAAASNTDDRNAVVFASRSSPKPVARASSHSNVSKSGRPSRRAPNNTAARMPDADPKCVEASASVMATSEKDEFSRLLKAKINELGMSDRIEFTSSDTLSGKLTAPVLQELISALNNDMHVSASQSSNCFEGSATLYSSGNGACIDESGYAFSDDRSPDFQKCYQGEQEVDSSAASMNNEPNQPSPMSVLEACFSNDTSSLGSPVEKNESKDLFVPIEKKMEDFFNLESDIVELEKSIDMRKAGAEEMFHGDGMLSCLENSVAHDLKFLESRLHSIAEAISNAELLLGSGLTHSTTSSLALHPFIMDMLETSAGVFGGELSLDLAEEKKYQDTNFLFDCIIESLDSKFGYFGKCGYKAWLKLPLSLSKGQLKQELVEVIGNWKESGAALSRVADKELDQVTTSWDACQTEVFDISVSIEDDILEALAVELALELW